MDLNAGPGRERDSLGIVLISNIKKEYAKEIICQLELAKKKKNEAKDKASLHHDGQCLGNLVMRQSTGRDPILPEQVEYNLPPDFQPLTPPT